MILFLDLSRHVEALRPELERALAQVLDSGRFVFGPAVEEFEGAFAAYCGAEHAVGVASGTDAIAIALRAVGVGSGDEVVTVANTCVPTVSGIEAAGATPVLVDVDPVSFTLDPGLLGGVVTDRTRAVVPVHLYGQCADMRPVVEFASARGLKVVEDAAQAHGAEYEGRRSGTLGDAAAFSFYPTKNLGALGDGGAVVTNHGDVAERARLIRNYGERERYDSVLRGGNSRLDAIQAAVLSAKLPHLDRLNDRRREIAGRYLEALRSLPLQLPVEAGGRRHVYHLFVVQVTERERFRRELADAGVGTLVHYPRPIHHQDAYRSLVPEGRLLPVSERLCDEVVSLPLYPELEDDEVEAVIRAVERIVDRLF